MKIHSSLSVHTASFPITNMSSSPLLQALVEGLGWDNIQVDILERDAIQQSSEQRIKWAMKNYEQFPNANHADHLIEQLENLIKSLTKEKKYAEEQEQFYQRQISSQNNKSYRSFSSIGRWAFDNIKDFFGSSPGALKEKYADIAIARQRQIKQAQTYLKAVRQNRQQLGKKTNSNTGSELVPLHTPMKHQNAPKAKMGSQTQSQEAFNTVITVNPIPNQLIYVNQPWSYSLNSVFTGEYTLLGAAQRVLSTTPEIEAPLPSWRVYEISRLDQTNGGTS